MLPAFIALLSALTYGAADFFGGIATRRSTTVAAVIVSQAAGLILLAAVIAFLPGSLPGAADITWGAIAGLAGGTGVALLYRALAIGPMSIVAPVTAVCAAIIPVAVGVTLGERLTTMTMAGIAMALVAIVLVGQEPRTGATAAVRWDGLRIALASGVLIGIFLVALARASQASGLWPLIPARVVSIGLFTIIAGATAQPMLVPRPVMAVALGGGALDMMANALYLMAVQRGPLSLMATLASLYPASTIVLARVFLGERWSMLQVLGIVCAIVATVLIVSGSA